MSTLPGYTIPDTTDYASIREYISGLPSSDKPELFGQHPNADIASQIKETNRLLSYLLSLQPLITTGAGVSREEKVLTTLDDVLKRIPDDIDVADASLPTDNSEAAPLNVVLLQEIKRYNELLGTVRKTAEDLQKGIRGFVVMTKELEDMFLSIFEGKVPALWSKAYSSLKPLAAWIRDLVSRIEFFADWAKG